MLEDVKFTFLSQNISTSNCTTVVRFLWLFFHLHVLHCEPTMNKSSGGYWWPSPVFRLRHCVVFSGKRNPCRITCWPKRRRMNQAATSCLQCNAIQNDIRCHGIWPHSEQGSFVPGFAFARMDWSNDYCYARIRTSDRTRTLFASVLGELEPTGLNTTANLTNIGAGFDLVIPGSTNWSFSCRWIELGNQRNRSNHADVL